MSVRVCGVLGPDADGRVWIKLFADGKDINLSVPKDSMMGEALLAEMKPHCCEHDCAKDAEFAIYGTSGHPEDCTHACRAHVGDMLGSIEGATPNRRWEVILIEDDPATVKPEVIP